MAEEIIELGELGADTEELLAAEALGAELDATGVFAPIGIIIGVLGALRFGHHTIVKYIEDRITNHPDYDYSTVERYRHKPTLHEEVKAAVDPKNHQQIVEDIKYNYPHLVVPLSKYTGPGNPLNSGKPANDVDADAREHDYNYADKPEDVKEFDYKLLRQAGDHIVEQFKNPFNDPVAFGQAVIQGVGIGSKRLVESQTGQLYPSKNMVSGN